MATDETTVPAVHRQFLVGIISLGLGNGFFAIRYAFDRATLGPLTTVGSVGHVLAMLGTAVIAHIAYANPDAFDFESSTTKRYASPFVLGVGVVTAVAGVLTFVVAVAG